MNQDTPTPLPQAIALIRDRRPLVHLITNIVSMAACAQAVNSLDASTLFAHDPHEALEAALAAQAVVLNVGTSVPGMARTVLRVANGCRDAGIPVVLDPVGVRATAHRRNLVRALIDTGGITAVSGNAAEAAFLAGIDATSRGADSRSTAAPPAEIAAAAAAATGTLIALSGTVDYVATGTSLTAVDNGHAVMGRVVGTGSSRSAVLGAFLAVAPGQPLRAVLTGVCAYGVAGEQAAARADGPGYFLPELYNALAALTDQDVTAHARIGTTPTHV